MPINNSGRKKLTIVKVLERRKVGEAEVLEFTAHIEGEEGNAKHGVWSRPLDQYIEESAVIDCDVVTKKSEKVDPDGNPYWNRKVTQIYIDGKPVSEKKEWKGGYRERPDNSASIESQVAAKIVAELIIAGKVLPGESLAITLLQWCQKRLGDPGDSARQRLKSESAIDSPAKKEVMPLTAKAVYDRFAQLVKAKPLDQAGAFQILGEFGAVGEKTWDMIKSLAPKKLSDLNAYLDEELKKLENIPH